MPRWFSVLQSRTESNEEGRYERVVDGAHEANKGSLYIILIAVGAVIVTTVVILMVIRFSQSV